MAKVNKKGLGRGIDALFQDINTPDLTLDNVSDLALTDIRPNPYQPRKTFDQAGLNDLADSIRQNGVFQPIIVRKSVNGYEIITGERRFRASKLAGRDTIPAIVREFDDPQMMEIAVIENLQREDLTPLDEAQAYDTLIKRLKLTQAEVSKRLGKSRPYIANYLRLLTSLKDKQKLVAVAKKTVTDGLTVRQLERLINQMNAGDAKPTRTPKPKSPFVRASEEQLAAHFGTKVAITSAAKGRGKLEIDFEDEADLTRILDLLHVNID
jgi:ParB family chromosome partitioning protein